MNESDLIIVSSSCSAALEVAECGRPRKHWKGIVALQQRVSHRHMWGLDTVN